MRTRFCFFVAPFAASHLSIFKVSRSTGLSPCEPVLTLPIYTYTKRTRSRIASQRCHATSTSTSVLDGTLLCVVSSVDIHRCHYVTGPPHNAVPLFNQSYDGWPRSTYVRAPKGLARARHGLGSSQLKLTARAMLGELPLGVWRRISAESLKRPRSSSTSALERAGAVA